MRIYRTGKPTQSSQITRDLQCEKGYDAREPDGENYSKVAADLRAESSVGFRN